MTKGLYWIIISLAMWFSTQASAILLDCNDLGDGTYTCVEVKNAYMPPSEHASQNQPEDADNPYLEQAKKACAYEKPRTHSPMGRHSSAARMEALKSAQEKYDRCVAEKAWELKDKQ